MSTRNSLLDSCLSLKDVRDGAYYFLCLPKSWRCFVHSFAKVAGCCVGMAFYQVSVASSQTNQLPNGTSSWPAFPLPKGQSELSSYSKKIGIQSAFDECIQFAGAVDPMTRECLDKEYAFQEKRLDRVYAKLISMTKYSGAKELSEEQDRWLTWRRNTCKDYDIELAAYECEVTMMADRAAQLESREEKS